MDSQGYVEIRTDNRHSVSSNCHNCGRQDELYDLTIGSYVASWEGGILDEESVLIRQKVSKNPVKKSENENDYYVEGSLGIPGLLLKMWGKMDKEKYENLRANSSFMQLKLKFCYECYLRFTEM